MIEELNSRQKDAMAKAAKYCAYQERSQQEVRSKLYNLGLYRDEVEEVISVLITQNYINEERFAKAYAGGKFRTKKWGKNKIMLGLKQHNISNYCIQIGMNEIDPSDYDATLQELMAKKSNMVSDDNLFSKRNKVAKYAIGRGYEPELVWDTIKEIIP